MLNKLVNFIIILMLGKIQFNQKCVSKAIYTPRSFLQVFRHRHTTGV